MTDQYPNPQQPYGTPLGGPDPLNGLAQPYYGASFGTALSRYWKKYATFSGRASRSEYWWAYLGNVIVFALLYLFFIVGAVTTGDDDSPGVLGIVAIVLLAAYALAIIVPTFALLWRRLHDANLPGALALLVLVLSGLWALITGLLPPNPDGRRYDR